MNKRGLATITEQEVLDAYVNKTDASLDSAANSVGCSREVFRRALHKFGHTAKQKMRNWHRKSEIPQLSDRAWLADQLQTKTARQIARELGTTSGNVADRVVRYGIRSKVLTKAEIIRAALTAPEGDDDVGA